MKKKNLGRVAALGIAAITAVPAFGITASADVSYGVGVGANATAMYISGTAYRQTWLVQKEVTDYWFWVETNTSSGAATLRSDTGVSAPQVLASADAMTVTYDAVQVTPTTVITVGAGCGTGNSYYTTQKAANDAVKDIKTAITESSRVSSADVSAARTMWQEYVNFLNLKNSAKTAFDQGKTEYRTSFKGIPLIMEGSYGDFYKYTVTNGTVAKTDVYDVAEPTVATATSHMSKTIYSFALAPNATPVTMQQLSDALGPMVDITNGVITGSSSGAYYINTTGGSTTTTTTTPTTTTATATYYVPAGYRYASDVSYYSPDTLSYYPNLEALRAAVGYTTTNYSTKTPATKYSSATPYFDPVTGEYVSSTSGSSYAISVTSGTVSGNYYYSYTTGRYYATYSEALNASGGDASKVVYVGSSAASTTNYNDPYWYYFNYMKNNNNNNSSSSSSSSVSINGKSGWSAVSSSVKNAGSGASLTVAMNGEDVVPSSVTSAMQGKNVDVNFKLSNGAVVTINGKDIDTAKSIDVSTTYNTKNVPTKLVQKAGTVNNGVMTAQISVGSGASLGASADVTVKFSASRAGTTAKLYRYDSSKNSLKLVDTSKVSTTGKCTFDGVTKGGDFVVVLC